MSSLRSCLGIFPSGRCSGLLHPPSWRGTRLCSSTQATFPAAPSQLRASFDDAGFPQNLFRTLLIPSRDVRALIEDPSIAAITLTGSVDAGRQVAEAAGAALKKTVLELGGSDAYLVLADANIERAAEICAAARMVNGGQSCIAGKQFIVVLEVREAFELALVDRMQSYTIGDPRDSERNLVPCRASGPATTSTPKWRRASRREHACSRAEKSPNSRELGTRRR